MKKYNHTKVVERHAKGDPIDALARKAGVQPATIRSILRAAGIYVRKRGAGRKPAPPPEPDTLNKIKAIAKKVKS